ncbi:hypothetical protein KIW84_030832 [Lathyrus oleraceus]|uniref:Uncharacterized protein n=1 Tax=Pisum sativum TaxID=3888 RepID=A0A9D5AWR7_PEA|nr:hypothetical protein KIW84_030832 [Pisum sativum]
MAETGVIGITNDMPRNIKECAIFDQNAMNTRIVRPEITVARFEFKLMMFQMLQAIGQYYGTSNEDPHLHLRKFLELETFYNGLVPSSRNMLDASSRRELLSKSYQEGYSLIENIMANTYQWSITKATAGTTQNKHVGVHEVSETTTLAAHVAQILK